MTENKIFFAVNNLKNLLWVDFLFISKRYRVAHKGWDCKDDLKLIEYDDPKSSSLHAVFSNHENEEYPL